MLRAQARRLGFAALAAVALITLMAPAHAAPFDGAVEKVEQQVPAWVEYVKVAADDVEGCSDTDDAAILASRAQDACGRLPEQEEEPREGSTSPSSDEERREAKQERSQGDGSEQRRDQRPAGVKGQAGGVAGAAAPIAEKARQAADAMRDLLADVERHARDTAATLPALLPGDEDRGGPAQDYDVAATAAEPTHALPGLWIAAGAAAATGLTLIWLTGSSSVAGSAAAKGGVEGLRRVTPGLALFTRFERQTVMEHPNREQLYHLVSQQPGIRLQDLCDATGLSRTAVTHHLRLLEQQHLVVSRRVGRSRHYFENGGRFARGQKDAYAVLTNERSRTIARYIGSHPGTIQKGLCEALGLRASIVHWHVQRLEEASLVESRRNGRTVSYFPGEALAGVTA